MATIEVEGKKYKVTETIRRNAGCAYTAKFVETPDGEKVAVQRGGVWTWWTARDRLQVGGPVVGMSANAHALAEERSDDSQKRVVGT